MSERIAGHYKYVYVPACAVAVAVSDENATVLPQVPAGFTLSVLQSGHTPGIPTVTL